MKVKIFLLALLFIAPFQTFASVRISEVMYDVSGADTGREWIEVVNQGSTPVDLSTYKVFEGGVNHKIIVLKGDALLAAGDAAIIADNSTKFLSDWPNTPGAVFDSAFSLSNSGETIGIRNKELKDEDTVTFPGTGASGNGLSLSRGSDGSFVPTKPTPGVYVAAPVKAVIAAPKLAVTAPAKAQLQTKAPSSAGIESSAEAQSASAPAPLKETGEQPSAADTAASVWVWALGALGLSVLGAGGVYALRVSAPMEVSNKEAAQRSLQQEADTYEIIE